MIFQSDTFYMKTIIILICVGSCMAWSKNPGRAEFTPLPVGSDSINTNFEKLTCTKMISSFLSYVASSGLGQSSIDSRFRACLNTSRSGLFGGVMAKVRVVTDADRECLAAATREQENLENAKQRFITALETRENIYHQKNIRNPNLLSKCDSARASELKRRSGESDYDLIRRGMFSCKMNPDLSYEYNVFRNAYSNPQDFAEQEKCRNYREEYFAERYPPLTIRSNQQANNDTPAASNPSLRDRVCRDDLTCDQVRALHVSGVGVASICYRNKFIDCEVARSQTAPSSTPPTVNRNQ
jgi:hypothetical protein